MPKNKTSNKKIKSLPDANELEIVYFDNTVDWRNWLEQNKDNFKGVWLQFYKKASGVATLNHALALDEALCYGWIDGQSKKHDENSWLQKFTPRRPRSIWSKKNIENIIRLEMEGKMRPPGLKEVEAAKADGRWERAYDSPENMKMPDDFLIELSKDKKAKAFFETLNKSNTYAIAWRLQTAKKPETREKRKKAILEMLSRGEKLYG